MHWAAADCMCFDEQATHLRNSKGIKQTWTTTTDAKLNAQKVLEHVPLENPLQDLRAY